MRATLEVSAVPVVLNQEYHISEQENLTCDVTGRGVPYDEFLFQLGNDNGYWSDEAKATVNAQVNSNTPAVVLTNQTIATGGLKDITSAFAFNDSTDRVKITSMTAKKGIVYVNGVALIIGKIYFLYDFINITFASIVPLTSQNEVATLAVEPGDKDGFEAASNLDITTTGNLQGSIYGTSNTNVA
jgi:hypothetical protein